MRIFAILLLLAFTLSGCVNFDPAPRTPPQPQTQPASGL